MKYYLVLATVLAVCSWVASDSNYYNIVTELGRQCKPRVGGATDTDVKILAIYKPVWREVQKELLHCVYQKIKIICGEFLNGIEFLSLAYARFYDGDSVKFNDVSVKIQKCYEAGEKFDGKDGLNVTWEIYDCLRQQWNLDKRSAKSNERKVSYIQEYGSGMYMVLV